jgi:single-stranded DNA-binding protein
MPHFVGAGTIATSIVRKETRNGVLATFRLASGPPGRGQIWIDIEAWGNLAGIIYQHGTKGRGVLVAGRLTLKTWRDRSSGESRRRYVITAHDIDLLPDHLDLTAGIDCHNAVIATGNVNSEPTTRPAGNGTVTQFNLASGRAGSKTGRLWIKVEYWQPNDASALCQHRHVIVSGRLSYSIRGAPDDGCDRSRYYINARTVMESKTGALAK